MRNERFEIAWNVEENWKNGSLKRNLRVLIFVFLGLLE